jgi:diguanylate cyclase (GGDEF)-like protein
MESYAELRASHLSSRRDGDQSQAQARHAQLLLRALETLLLTGHADDPFPIVFKSLQHVFAFERAMVLTETHKDVIHCIAAVPDDMVGVGWTAAERPGRAADPVPAARSVHELDGWWNLPRDLIPAARSALYLPFGVRQRRGLVILSRREGQTIFDPDDVSVGQQFALLASVALAMRDATEMETEGRLLRELIAQLRRSQQEAQHNADLLGKVMELLPVGLTVQGESGRLILVNGVAATNSNLRPDGPIGTSPTDVLSGEPVSGSRRQDADTIEIGQLATAEETVGPNGERTLLTSHKSVRIFDEILLLSASLDITERKQAENELARRAYFDELTGLAKGALIQEHVEDVLKRKGKDGRFALAFIDLDNFKHINDYYSHAVGDALLVKVAERIGARIRQSDMLARISGDEFVLLVEPIEGDDEVQALVDHLLDALKEPFYIEGFEVLTSASIGVSVCPDHGQDYAALRRNADSALSRAKSGSKGSAAVFDRNMGQAVTARMELEQRLRLAIRDRQFRCAFQPKVDIRSEEVVGFEALIRWCDERGTIQAPSDFVGLAIELGLIDPITQFVTAEAVNALEQLDGEFGADTTMSINVAAKQAGDLKFMRALTDALADTGCPQRFMLELTEDAFLARSRFQLHVLPMLREIGVRVSIDDFGTGYSSLSELADITADEIKVDRSFITAIHQRPRSQSVLKAIESLSDALGMTVIAEGVESFEELAYLQAATRIRYAQGFYFAKPFFLEDFSTTKRVAPGARALAQPRERTETRGVHSPRGGVERRE